MSFSHLPLQPPVSWWNKLSIVAGVTECTCPETTLKKMHEGTEEAISFEEMFYYAAHKMSRDAIIYL